MKRLKGIPFIITMSYLIGFLAIRLSVFLAGSADSEFASAAAVGELPAVNFYIGTNIILFGYHIHHFYIGIALICIAGWLALVGCEYLTQKQLAVMYGVGLGLFFDEIGLLLTWGDYYSRLSYLLTLFLAGLFLNIVFFHDFWISVRHNVTAPSSENFLQSYLKQHKVVLRAIDVVSYLTGKTERASLIFTGVVYTFIGIFICFNPQTVRHWVSIALFVQGIDFLVKFVKY